MKDAKFSLSFDGPFTGVMHLEDEIAPPPPEPPVAEETHIWFQDGKDMSIFVRDQKLNQYMTPERPGETIQAVYRSGTLAGQFQLPQSQPVQDGSLFIRFDGLPWKFPGLHSWVPGHCWYRNRDNFDLTPGLCRFEDSNPNGGGPYHMYFYFADPASSNRMKRLQNGFPYNWKQYGLDLSFMVLVP